MFRLVRFLALACLLPIAASAADDPYIVKNVHVDASAVSSTEALNQAVAQGRPRAWQIVFRRLARQADWSRQPVLDDLAIQRLMRGFTVANERRSTTRYVGDVTYIFNADQVRRVMRQAGLLYTDQQGKKILIVPMSPGYAKNSPWVGAWNNPKALSGGWVPLALPAGDGADMAVLGKFDFDKASWSKFAPLAARAGASEVALLQLAGGAVHIRHLSPTPVPDGAVTEVPVPPGNLGQAVSATQIVLDDYAKARSVADLNHHGRSIVVARFDSLGDWTTMLSVLTNQKSVTNVEIVAIDYGEARLGVSYVGSLDTVHDALANGRIALTSDDGSWSLAMAPPKNQ